MNSKVKCYYFLLFRPSKIPKIPRLVFRELLCQYLITNTFSSIITAIIFVLEFYISTVSANTKTLMQSSSKPAQNSNTINSELYMSSKQWLQQHSLKRKKLTFYDFLQTVAFKHCDGVTQNLQPNPAARDAVSFYEISQELWTRFPSFRNDISAFLHIFCPNMLRCAVLFLFLLWK